MQEALESIVLLLSPIVPHICHELWRELKPGTELLNGLGHKQTMLPWYRMKLS